VAFRLYLVPSIGTGIFPDARRAKYFKDDLGVPYASMDYGFQPVFIVGADLSPADQAFIDAQPDASSFPANLDVPLSAGEATNASTLLESFFIPAHWVTAALTWRETARITCGMFQYFQRVNGILGSVILLDGTSNKTLNTQWQVIPVNIQQGLLEAARSLGYDTSFIANNTQVRAIIKNFSDQWGSKPFIFGNNEI
jgi:hypothetical protein